MAGPGPGPGLGGSFRKVLNLVPKKLNLVVPSTQQFKETFYLVQSSFGLGVAYSPLHPLPQAALRTQSLVHSLLEVFVVKFQVILCT